jgi:hypothetical protein
MSENLRLLGLIPERMPSDLSLFYRGLTTTSHVIRDLAVDFDYWSDGKG